MFAYSITRRCTSIRGKSKLQLQAKQLNPIVHLRSTVSAGKCA